MEKDPGPEVPGLKTSVCGLKHPLQFTCHAPPGVTGFRVTGDPPEQGIPVQLKEASASLTATRLRVSVAT
jgi:hypothetical protein